MAFVFQGRYEPQVEAWMRAFCETLSEKDRRRFAALEAARLGLGALGAHALKSQLSAEQLATYHTAVQYQMYHAIGMVLIGLLGLHRQSGWFDAAGWTMLIGIILFSGLLYAWVATGQRVFVHAVPVGGVAFIIAWILVAIGILGLGQK